MLHHATRLNVPQDGIRYSHRRENLKSYIPAVVSKQKMWYEGRKGEKIESRRASVIYKNSSYLTGNTLRLRYKAQPVNAVGGNSRCLF
jgi:hypothetical protein